MDWNTIQRGNNHLILLCYLKPIIKLTGVIVGLSPMKWTGRNLCHQLNSWWVFNRLKGQGKVKLKYAVVMDKLDIDVGMISYWDYETWYSSICWSSCCFVWASSGWTMSKNNQTFRIIYYLYYRIMYNINIFDRRFCRWMMILRDL